MKYTYIYIGNSCDVILNVLLKLGNLVITVMLIINVGDTLKNRVAVKAYTGCIRLSVEPRRVLLVISRGSTRRTKLR